MSAVVSSELELRMARLKRDFRRRLESEADDLRELAGDDDDQLDRSRILEIAHRLIGSAAQFGFPEVSLAAERLHEGAIDPASSGAELTMRLRGLVGAIEGGLRGRRTRSHEAVRAIGL